ncbi:hypothetical protein K6Y31_18730 [Motilimonas cestriensis]|uniref:Uncharacterized protein n=1 Tax=Motilimonas cestriensis TaxID=2742685 RepID=A0ABS8WCP2_9GAMM|nr:hypothetical protein [Motilimonas cestriensis]MCE2596814.1 hypothetical protein [Motilimonas cestriensis]
MKLGLFPNNLMATILSQANPNKVQENSTSLSQDTLHTLTTDTYYKGKEQEPDPVYSRPMVITESKYTVAEMEERQRMRDIALGQLYLGGDMFHAADQMTNHYDEFMSKIEAENPKLADKNWGFSVNAEGAIEVTGKLADTEKRYLENILNEDTSFVWLAQGIKEDFLKYTEMERGGPDGTSQYWGKYDVNEDNFGDIIDMRELIEVSRETNEATTLFGRNLNVFRFVGNFGSQLGINADVKHASA